MLPTVYEDSEEDSSNPVTTFSNSGYCLDFRPSYDQLLKFNLFPDCLQAAINIPKPVVVISPGYPDVILPPSLSDLLAMANVLTSAEVEGLMIKAEQTTTSGGSGATLNGGGGAGELAATNDVAIKKEVEEVVAATSNGDAGVVIEGREKDANSPGKTRKDSESGRSGDERERRNSGNRRNGRGQPKKQREKSKCGILL